MIQPASSNNVNGFINNAVRKSNSSEIKVYYVIAFLLTLVNFAPIFYNHNINNETNFEHEENEQIPWSLIYWFVSSCVLSIPLILEFSLDTAVSVMYPIYYHNMLEHRFGQSLLLFSLFIPIILVIMVLHAASDLNLLTCYSLVSFCESLAFTAIFGILQVFGQGECWKILNSLLVLVVFVLAQQMLMMQTTDRLEYSGMIAALTLFLLSLVLVFSFARKNFTELYGIFSGSQQGAAAPINSNKYKCLVLLVLLCVYLTARVWLVIGLITVDTDLSDVIGAQMALFLMLAVGGAVLPGWMIRRGIVALKVCKPCLLI